jgi:hypothetical protein
MAQKIIAIWLIKIFDTAVNGRTLINVRSEKCLWRAVQRAQKDCKKRVITTGRRFLRKMQRPLTRRCAPTSPTRGEVKIFHNFYQKALFFFGKEE